MARERRAAGAPARPLGRRSQSMGVGETINAAGRRAQLVRHAPQSGTRHACTLPAEHHRRRRRKPYGPLAPGADDDRDLLRLEQLHERDAARAPAARTPSHQRHVPITTTYSRPRPGSREPDAVDRARRRRSRPPRARRRSTAPRARASTRARRWTSAASGSRAAATATAPARASTAGPPPRPARAGSTYAKVTRHGDDLYFFVHVKDDFQCYAVTPAECVGHWQADSVELLIDPRGNAPGAQPRHGDDLQARRLPVHQRPGEHATATAPTARAGRATPTTTRATRPARSQRPVSDAPNAPGVQVASTRDLGRHQRHDGRPRLRRRRLHDRGQDPDGRPPGRRGPGPDGPEHHALRQRRQHGRHGLDEAAAHRHEHAPRVVDVRQRPVGSVPLGPRDAAGLHAAGGPPDHAGGRRTCPTRTSTARRRRRRSRSPRATASRSPAGSPAPAGDRITAAKARLRGLLGRARPDVQRRRDGPGVPVDGRHGLHPRVEDELRPGDGPGRRTTACPPARWPTATRRRGRRT